jgi:hypothetical protein
MRQCSWQYHASYTLIRSTAKLEFTCTIAPTQAVSIRVRRRCSGGTAAKLGVQAPEGIFASFFGREWTRGLGFEIGEDRRRSRGAGC